MMIYGWCYRYHSVIEHNHSYFSLTLGVCNDHDHILPRRRDLYSNLQRIFQFGRYVGSLDKFFLLLYNYVSVDTYKDLNYKYYPDWPSLSLWVVTTLFTPYRYGTLWQGINFRVMIVYTILYLLGVFIPRFTLVGLLLSDT